MTSVVGVSRPQKTADSGAEATRFRPDIEGLRAVAVLLVLAYHAGIPQVSGGFIGVDVFFVISGFLITGLLVREVQTTGRVSLRRFYARRARRLLPATAVVLLATSVLTIVFLPPLRWAQVAWDIVTSAVYVVNWRLAADAVDYLAAENAASPVQHFWSLAVEEQFYLLWPLLIIALAWWQRRSGRSLRWIMLAGLAAIAVPSLLYSVYLTGAEPDRAYFVSTTRAWELAVGAALAIAAPRLARLPRTVCVPAAWAGLVAIAVAALSYDASTAFPGYTALLPTLGAAAVIAAGVGPAGSAGAGAMLGVAPMRWVGALSYSIYLWHWPLLIAATAAWGELSVTRGVAVAAASVVPAWLTFKLVERPIHHAPALAARPGRALGVGALATAVGLIAAIVPTAFTPDYDVDGDAPGAAVLGDQPASDPDGVPVDEVTAITPDPLRARDDNADVYGDGCHQNQQDAEVLSCTYGDVDSDYVVALVGDSHAAQWQPTLDEIGRRQGWRVQTYTKSSCGFFSVDVSTADDTAYTSCSEWNEALLEQLTGNQRPDVVVTSGSNNYRVLVDGEPVDDADNRDRFAAGMADSWQAVVKSGAHLVVLHNTPWLDLDVPECVSEHPDQLTECAADRASAMEAAGDVQLAAAERVPGAQLVDLNRYVCPADQCAAVIGNVIVWRDPHHLTATYARTLASRLDEELAPLVG